MYVFMYVCMRGGGEGEQAKAYLTTQGLLDIAGDVPSNLDREGRREGGREGEREGIPDNAGPFGHCREWCPESVPGRWRLILPRRRRRRGRSLGAR